MKAARRPVFGPREGKHRAEPVELRGEFASLMSDSSARGRKVQYAEPMWSPPQCVADRPAGKQVSVPPYPLCALGPDLDELKVPYSEEDRSDCIEGDV